MFLSTKSTSMPLVGEMVGLTLDTINTKQFCLGLKSTKVAQSDIFFSLQKPYLFGLFCLCLVGLSVYLFPHLTNIY